MKALTKINLLLFSSALIFYPFITSGNTSPGTKELKYTFYRSTIGSTDYKYDLGKIHILASPVDCAIRATNNGTDTVTIFSVMFTGDLEFQKTWELTGSNKLAPNASTPLIVYNYLSQNVGIHYSELIIISDATTSPDTLTFKTETVNPGFGPWEWKFIGCPNGDSSIGSIYIDPEDDNIWYVRSPNNLYITRDGGNSWEISYSCNDCFPGIVAIDSKDPVRIYMVAGNKLYSSIDKGLTWDLKFLMGESSPTCVAINSNDGTIYVPSGVGVDGNKKNPGVYISSDLGTTWSFHSFGYEEDNLLIYDIQHDPKSGILYVCAEIGDHPQPYNPPFFRSLDNGITWEEVSNELYWHGLRIQVNPDNQVVYCILESSNLFKSADYGLSWQNMSYCVWQDLLLDPVHDNCLFGSSGTFGGAWHGGVYVSIDEAAHYDLIGLSYLSVGSLRLNSTSSKLFAIAKDVGIFMTPVPEIINVTPFLLRGSGTVNDYSGIILYLRVIFSEDAVMYIVPENTEKDLDIIKSTCIDSVSVYANIATDYYVRDLESGTYWVYAADSTGLISDHSLFVVPEEFPTAELELLPASSYVDYLDGTSRFFVITNTGWTVTESADWLSCTPTSGFFNYPIDIHYQSNDLAVIRSTEITIKGGGITRIFKITQDGVTGIEDMQTNEFLIYPIPTYDKLNIQTYKIDKYSIEITSLNGQLIFSTMMQESSHQLDLSRFQKGVYLITIRSKDYVTTKKIIKL